MYSGRFGERPEIMAKGLGIIATSFEIVIGLPAL